MMTAPIVIVPKSIKDGWYAVLSDGREFRQEDLDGYLSAWLRLKSLCEKDRVYITRLFLTVGTVTIEIGDQKLGYWQAQKMVVSEFYSGEDIDHHWRGIGYVDNIGRVIIRWLAYPHTPLALEIPNVYTVLNDNRVVALAADEIRLASTQTQIIWSDPDRSEVQ